jgi:hypothetical protein
MSAATYRAHCHPTAGPQNAQRGRGVRWSHCTHPTVGPVHAAAEHGRIPSSSLISMGSTSCTVRAFRQEFSHSRMPLCFTPLLRSKRYHACDQWHFSRMCIPLAGWTVNYIQTLKGPYLHNGAVPVTVYFWYGARFPTQMCTRGCHWLPFMLA